MLTVHVLCQHTQVCVINDLANAKHYIYIVYKSKAKVSYFGEKEECADSDVHTDNRHLSHVNISTCIILFIYFFHVRKKIFFLEYICYIIYKTKYPNYLKVPYNAIKRET